jgi:hypothetical protein
VVVKLSFCLTALYVKILVKVVVTLLGVIVIVVDVVIAEEVTVACGEVTVSVLRNVNKCAFYHHSSYRSS